MSVFTGPVLMYNTEVEPGRDLRWSHLNPLMPVFFQAGCSPNVSLPHVPLSSCEGVSSPQPSLLHCLH